MQQKVVSRSPSVPSRWVLEEREGDFWLPALLSPAMATFLAFHDSEIDPITEGEGTTYC